MASASIPIGPALQAMAFVLVAGFSPAPGIMTAVVASTLGAAVGSSEFQVNEPTNAIAVMLAAQISLSADLSDPFSRIVALTLLIGVVQLLAGGCG